MPFPPDIIKLRGLTVRAEALVGVSFVTLTQINTNTIVGTWTRETGVFFFAVGTDEPGAALALEAFLQLG